MLKREAAIERGKQLRVSVQTTEKERESERCRRRREFAVLTRSERGRGDDCENYGCLERDRVNDPCGFAVFQTLTGCHAVDSERKDLFWHTAGG